MTDPSWRDAVPAVPPPQTPGRRSRHRPYRQHRPSRQHPYTAVGTALLLAGMLGYVGLVDPHNTTSLYPPCLFRWLTGWNCPFCGGLRMTHDLLRGDLAAGVNDNVFALVGIPMLAGWILLRRRRGKEPLPISGVVMVTVAAALWTVVRNMPGFPLVPTVLGG